MPQVYTDEARRPRIHARYFFIVLEGGLTLEPNAASRFSM